MVAAVVGVTGSAAALPIVPAYANAGATTRLGSPPAIPRGATPLAAVAATTPMRITVALQPRDPAGLAAYVRAVSDPTSVLYRHFLTPAQFSRRFGPTPAAAAAVVASLRAHGLNPGRRSAGGLSLPVRARAGQIARALRLSFAWLRLPDGRTAVVNVQAPAVEDRIARSVQAILGLSSLARMHPETAPRTARATPAVPSRAAYALTGGPQPCPAAMAAAPSQKAYTADQIASAYGFTGLYQAGDLGQGETIALYELEPNDPADIAAYQSCYGTGTQIGYVPVDGGAGSGAGSGEAALDIEQAIALAPRARLLVYQGPNANQDAPGSGPYDVFSAIINADQAQVVSNSWGECEPMEGQTNAGAEAVLFQQAAAEGQTIVSAAGDAGSEDCDNGTGLPNTELAVDDPGSQPLVTSVGGTSLAAAGPPPSETVWNNGGNLGGLLGLQPGAGGGGISRLWPMPAYQSGAPAGLNVIESGVSSGSPCHAGSGFCREVPDVSADADPNTGYLIYYNGSGTVSGSPSGWQGTGGTSGAAPVWAAVFALAGADSACQGIPIGFANPALYRAAGAGFGTYFHDVTAGNNDFTGSYGGRDYQAGAGYDLASGLGSPNAAALAPELCAQSLRIAAPSPQTSFLGAPAALQLSAADAPGSGLRFAARGVPPGLSLDAATGRVAGRATRAGSYTVTVSATDASGSVRAVSFGWTVVRAPRLTGVKLTSVGSGRPKLSFTLSADQPLHALAVKLPAGLSFAAPARRVRVTVSHATAVAHGILEVALTPAVRQAGVTVSLTARSALVRAVARRRRPKLKLTVTAVTASGASDTFTVTVKPRS